MKNKLKRGAKKPSDDHSNNGASDENQDVTTKPVAHTGNHQWYQTKAATIAIPVVLVAVAVTGYFISQNSGQQESSSTASKEASTKQTPSGNGLKKFTSANHGLQFTTPEAWQVAETRPTTNVENSPNSFVVSVRIPVEGTAAGLDFRIIEGNVDDLLNQTMNISNIPEGVGFEKAAVKWKNFDATKLTVNAAQDRKVTVLYVQAGKFIYILPEYENPPNGEKGKVASDNDWKTFTDSIEVKV